MAAAPSPSAIRTSSMNFCVSLPPRRPTLEPRLIPNATFMVAPSAQVLAQECEHLLPSIEGSSLPVLRPVDGEEGVSGFVVGVELVGLAELVERFSGLGGVVRRRAGVLHAEEAQQRTLQI